MSFVPIQRCFKNSTHLSIFVLPDAGGFFIDMVLTHLYSNEQYRGLMQCYQCTIIQLLLGLLLLSLLLFEVLPVAEGALVSRGTVALIANK